MPRRLSPRPSIVLLRGKIDKLKNAKPDDFSSEFDSMQVSAHKDAVSLFERYAKGGEDPKLMDWAGKTLPALKHHLTSAKRSNGAREICEAGG